MNKRFLIFLTALALPVVIALGQKSAPKFQAKKTGYARIDSVEFLLFNKAYGDSRPAYRIDGVVYNRTLGDRMEYLNKEIYLDFKSPRLQKQARAVDKPKCYRYLLYGVLYQNEQGTMKLEVQGGAIERLWCD